MTYKSILYHFSQCDISKDDVFKALLRLKKARNKDHFGHILIDKQEKKIDVNMSDTTPIILLPSGTFFTSTLVTSCEYIFWSALDTKVDYYFQHFLDGNNNLRYIEYSELQNDNVKSMIAVTFFCESILPVIIEEYHYAYEYKNPKIELDFKSMLMDYSSEILKLGENIITSLRKFISINVDHQRIPFMRSKLDDADDIIRKALKGEIENAE